MFDALRKHSFREDFRKAGQVARNGALGVSQFALDKFDQFFQKIDAAFAHVDKVMREGNYHSKPKSSLAQLLRAKRTGMPETVRVVAATSMVDTTLTVGKRFLWLSVFAMLTTESLIWTGIALGSIGAAVIGREYARAKKSAEETICELNFAGQLVEGRRSDLCRLHLAQTQIMNLADNFKRASLESTADTIESIVAGVAEEAKRVKVVAPGKYGASAEHYDFSEPCIKLVNDDHLTPISAIPTDAEIESLKRAWEENASNDNELRERVRQLEETISRLEKKTGGHAAPGPG